MELNTGLATNICIFKIIYAKQIFSDYKFSQDNQDLDF